MKPMAVVVVTLGFVGLIQMTLTRHWSPVFLCAYTIFFIGWELYPRIAHADAQKRRRDREAKGLCLQCGYDLTGNARNRCPECGDGERPGRMDRSMIPFRDALSATESLVARGARFRDRPFPTDWAKVVNGVGLASLTMRAQRDVDAMARLCRMGDRRLSYMHSVGEPRSTATALYESLHPLPADFDGFLPALPPVVRPYFADLRALVADAADLAERWWSIDAALQTPQPA